jgi:dihydrolipoamide dehydrogenase
MVVGELAQERDVVIIGGGPGGYHAAIRAAQLGLQVTLIEKNKMGGVCLNEGCIPSKVYATSSQKFAESSNLSAMGIEFSDVSMNLAKLQQYKNQIVSQLRQGVEALCKANKVEVVTGNGYFLSEDKIGVESGHQFDVYKFKNAIIATGCDREDQGEKHSHVFNQYSIYTLEETPDSLVVFGADYIAIEVAMTYQAFGTKVTLCLPDEDFPLDSSINRELIRICKKNKLKVYKNSSFKEFVSEDGQNRVTIQTGEDVMTIESSHCYLPTELKTNVKKIGLDRLKVNMTEDGFIETDLECRTSLPHIFAIGDVTAGAKLAVRAIRQGKVAAEVIAGQVSVFDEVFIPTIVHSSTPIASVGLTEAEAHQQYEQISVSQFPLAANGYASLTNQKDGFIKVISEKESGLILGVHILGQGAIELISSAGIGLEMVAREDDFKLTYYPHPSINEGLLEAFESLKGEAVHLPPTKQREKQTV